MARKLSDNELQKIHATAIMQLDRITSALRGERMQCLEDRRFVTIAGAMWEGSLADQYENKPKFEINKVAMAIRRIFSEYRNNRISADFVPSDGSENDELADTLDALYRADEQDSVADEAYDNAFDEATSGGIGAFRLRNVPVDQDDEDDDDYDDAPQRIAIEPIYDADSCVFFDIDARRYDKSDAKYCFVLSSMTPEAYEAEYERNPVSLQKEIQKTEFDWYSPDAVYVAEYYFFETEKDTVQTWENLDGSIEKHDLSALKDEPALLANLQAYGAKLIKEKSVKRKRVRKLIIDGSSVIEDCGHIAGRNIPIVPVFGNRSVIDGVERCSGHVRTSKDAQRLVNMMRSKLAELSAMPSQEKPIFTHEQIRGHEQWWADDAVQNYAYLTINSMTDATGMPIATGPAGYTHAPNIPPAMAALLQTVEVDLQDMLGNQQAGEELQPNMSGKAVELIQNRLDMQSFIYISNMAKSVKRGAEIWLSMAKDVYVEDGRKLKGVDAQGKPKQIELSKPIVTKDGERKTINDLSSARFGVHVEVGPSSSSKRSATVRALTGMMTITQDTETQQVLGAMAMMNMEGEGIQDAREFFRKRLVRMGVVKPSDEDLEAMQGEAQEPPSANDQYLQAAAEAEQARAIKARADTILTVEKADETRAKTIETLAGIESAQREQAIKVVESFGNQPSGMTAASTGPMIGE